MTILMGAFVLLALYLCTMLVLVQYKGDTSIANFTWGGGVMLSALYTFFTISQMLPRQIILTALIVFWAFRLILYLYARYTGRDPRFSSWKWQGLKALFINTLWILGQGIMIVLMSIPVVMVNTNTTPGFSYLDISGLLIWIVGFCYESVSDYQLFAFMRNPANKGHVMRSGLWRYSRHPNYFGEVLMWWGVYLITLSVPYGWAAIIAPLTITFLILFVTGIPLAEKPFINSLEYQEYRRTTSAFIPWFSQ